MAVCVWSMDKSTLRAAGRNPGFSAAAPGERGRSKGTKAHTPPLRPAADSTAKVPSASSTRSREPAGPVYLLPLPAHPDLVERLAVIMDFQAHGGRDFPQADARSRGPGMTDDVGRQRSGDAVKHGAAFPVRLVQTRKGSEARAGFGASGKLFRMSGERGNEPEIGEQGGAEVVRKPVHDPDRSGRDPPRARNLAPEGGGADGGRAGEAMQARVDHHERLCDAVVPPAADPLAPALVRPEEPMGEPARADLQSAPLLERRIEAPPAFPEAGFGGPARAVFGRLLAVRGRRHPDAASGRRRALPLGDVGEEAPDAERARGKRDALDLPVGDMRDAEVAAPFGIIVREVMLPGFQGMAESSHHFVRSSGRPDQADGLG